MWMQWHGTLWFLATRSYLEVISRMSEAIRQKCTELCKNQSWIMPHDNAPSHTSMLVLEFLTQNKTVIKPQPPYSSDLSSCWLIPLPQTEGTDERKESCYVWGGKNKFETGAIGDIKERVSGVFRGLYIWAYLRGITLKGTR